MFIRFKHLQNLVPVATSPRLASNDMGESWKPISATSSIRALHDSIVFVDRFNKPSAPLMNDHSIGLNCTKETHFVKRMALRNEQLMAVC
jgi:hypothetical protein